MHDRGRDENTDESMAGRGFKPVPAGNESAANPPGAGADADPQSMPGLCRHCDSHGHCTLGTREGPVWHCEHYR
jgi:hypothetical protein